MTNQPLATPPRASTTLLSSEGIPEIRPFPPPGKHRWWAGINHLETKLRSLQPMAAHPSYIYAQRKSPHPTGNDFQQPEGPCRASTKSFTAKKDGEGSGSHLQRPRWGVPSGSTAAAHCWVQGRHPGSRRGAPPAVWGWAAAGWQPGVPGTPWWSPLRSWLPEAGWGKTCNADTHSQHTFSWQGPPLPISSMVVSGPGDLFV